MSFRGRVFHPLTFLSPREDCYSHLDGTGLSCQPHPILSGRHFVMALQTSGAAFRHQPPPHYRRRSRQRHHLCPAWTQSGGTPPPPHPVWTLSGDRDPTYYPLTWGWLLLWASTLANLLARRSLPAPHLGVPRLGLRLRLLAPSPPPTTDQDSTPRSRFCIPSSLPFTLLGEDRLHLGHPASAACPPYLLPVLGLPTLERARLWPAPLPPWGSPPLRTPPPRVHFVV